MQLLLAITFGLLQTFSLGSVAARQQQNEQRKTPPATQTPKPTPSTGKSKKEDGAELAARRQQALVLLESAVEKARALESSVMKTKILALMADVLWESDETRARKLYVEALQVLDQLKIEAGRDPLTPAKTNAQNLPRIEDLRSDLFQRIARHDPNLAEKLRSEIKDTAGNGQASDRTSQNGKEDLAWDIAIAEAKTHPEQTARFVRTTLDRGINPVLGEALLGIRRENPQLADQLFIQAVLVARAMSDTLDTVETLAEYVLPTEEGAIEGRQPAADPNHAVAIRSFLGYLADRLASETVVGTNLGAHEIQHEYRTLHILLPLFESFMPERVAVVRERMAMLAPFLSTQQTDDSRAARLEQLENLVRQAESAVGDRKRDLGFIRASQAAATLGDFERAISLAERISDLEERTIQTSLLTYQTALKKLQQGEIEQASRLGRTIKFLPQRVALFISIAGKLQAKKEIDRARAVLEEIWDWTVKEDNTPQKAKALLTLTAKMADYDSNRSFEFLQSAVRTIDRTDFSVPETNGKPSRVVQVTLDMLDFNSSFSQLGLIDFERAAQAALSFNNKEASLFSQVIISQQILALRPGIQQQKFSK